MTKTTRHYSMWAVQLTFHPNQPCFLREGDYSHPQGPPVLFGDEAEAEGAASKRSHGAPKAVPVDVAVTLK